jgi:tetratricopeptide (TPR) repeat protein
VREDTPLGGGDDPCAGPAFPRLWTAQKEAAEDAIRVAGAALAVGSRHSQKALAVLEAARARSTAGEEGLALDIALANAYVKREDFEKLLPVAQRLLGAAPKSKTALAWTLMAQMATQRWPEAAATIAAHTQVAADDRDSLRAQANLAEFQGQFDRAIGFFTRLRDANRAEAGDLNNLAWDALFLDPLPADALANAQRAASMSQNKSPGILHTLAAVLAEAGKAAEARSIMLQSMDLWGLEEPNPQIWYLVGRIAEEYGEKEMARAAYTKVTKPLRQVDPPNSTYHLTQRRLKLMAASAK